MSHNRNRISSSKYSLAALTALPRLLMMAGGLCLLLPLPAIADPSPGSACPTNNVYTLTGGPETSGVGGLMVCVSNVWTAVYASDPLGSFGIKNSVSLSGDITPAQLTANTDNWAPIGLSTASVIRLSADAARNLTGLTGGVDGRIITLINVGTFTVTLKNSVTSTAANQFLFTADLALAANETVTIMYDSTAARWKLLAKGSANAGGGGGATDIDGLTDAFAEYVSNDDNLILGRPGAAALTSGVYNNIFIGRYAGATSANSATGMDSNIAIGVNPLGNLTTGANNIALGSSALEQNTTGSGNAAIGSTALQANTTGSSNVAIGLYTLLSNVSSDQNTAAGSGALMNNTGGANSAFGYSALITHTTGDENTAVGWDAMFYHDTGAGNTALGAYSLANLTSGDNNIAIGILAGEASTAGSKNIIIGHNIDLPSATASNQLNIGNIIYGTGIDGTDGTVSSGNIGIGTKTPGAKLDNAGSTALSGDITPAQLTANTDNWAPAGLSGASVMRVSANAARNLTGLTGGVDGRIVTLINVGTFTITLKNSVTSTAANQFLFTADLALAANETATIMYDSTASRWKLLAKGSATGVGDNLGNHIATANVQLNGNWLSGDGGAEGVFVSTFGDVGIGTSSPGANLDVSGTGDVTAIIRSTATNANTFLRFYSRAGGVNQIASIKSGWGGEFSFYPGSDAANAITFQNAAGTTTSLGIDTTNNRVGVGISFPSTTLENAGSTAFSGDITPTALAANTDNWAPTGLATASVIRVSASGAFQLTGITGGVDGRVLTLLNVGANTITLMNDVTSTAANRFLLGANLSVAANQSVTLLYDATASRWRMVAIGSVPAAIPQGTQCGLAKRTVTSGSCLTGAYTSVVTCEGVSIASSCPSGYTWTNWQTGQPPAGGTVYCQAVCFKD